MATAEAKLHRPESKNEPYVDFSKPENRKKMEDALKKVASEFGHEYPMWIGGQKGTTTEKRKSTNPSRPSQVIGVFQSATGEKARPAVEGANKYFHTSKPLPPAHPPKHPFLPAK